MPFSMILTPLAWCILSASFQPVDWLAGLGLGVLAAMGSRLLLPAPKTSVHLRLLPLLRFSLVAFFEMFPSAVRLIPPVLSGKVHASESLHPIALRHPLTRLMLCGAITMSPGTIAVRLEEDILHILTLLPDCKPVARTVSTGTERLHTMLLHAEKGV